MSSARLFNSNAFFLSFIIEVFMKMFREADSSAEKARLIPEPTSLTASALTFLTKF